MLAMGMWVCCQFFGRASDQNLINSWVAGALDSAWRAVNQYLYLNHNKKVRKDFYAKWGRTEYWDEAYNNELFKLNRRLTKRHLVIALHKNGVRLPS